MDESSEICRRFDHHEPSFVEDPWPALEEIREKCPVLHSDKYDGFWLLSKYDDVKTAARTPSDFTSTVPGTTSIPSIMGPRKEPLLPLELDPPEHSKYRALISPVFRNRRIRDLKPAIEARANELIDGLLTKDRVDFIAEFAVPLSLFTLGELMSLPTSDQRMLFEWVERMFEGSIRDPEDAKLAETEYAAYIEDTIENRVSDDPDDFFRLLLESEVDGRRMTKGEVQRFAKVLLIAGHETTAKSMGMSLWFLATHPEKRDELFADASLIPTAVEELLRLVPPVILFPRNATHDIQLQGETIKEGDVVALGFGSANRDPSVFDQPDEAKWDREHNPHMTFGHGPHLCVGAHVARLELAVMLELFSRRVPRFSLDPERPHEWKARGDQRGLVSLPVILEESPITAST